jgi:hypothetical protein
MMHGIGIQALNANSELALKDYIMGITARGFYSTQMASSMD